MNTEHIAAFACICLVLLGCTDPERNDGAVDEGVQAATPSRATAASPTPVTKSPRGTGSGQLKLPEGVFSFDLTDCTLDPFKLGFAEYDFQFTGAGVAPNGKKFNIMGHRALGTDGRAPITMQTVVLAIDTDAEPRQVPGTEMLIPAKRRILEATFYYTQAKGWTRPGSRPVEGDVEIDVTGDGLAASLPFGGAGIGEFGLKCTPALKPAA